MSMAQVEYIDKNVSKNEFLEKKILKTRNANGITRESSLYKNIIRVSLATVTVIFSLVLLYGYLNIAQQNRKINTLNSEIRSLETERDNYNIKLEPYKSVETISKLAKFKYNMDFPNKDQVKYVEKLR